MNFTFLVYSFKVYVSEKYYKEFLQVVSLQLVDYVCVVSFRTLCDFITGKRVCFSPSEDFWAFEQGPEVITEAQKPGFKPWPCFHLQGALNKSLTSLPFSLHGYKGFQCFFQASQER